MIIDNKSYTGDGSTRQFATSVFIASNSHIAVFLDNELQPTNSYDLLGSIILFETAPSIGVAINFVVSDTGEDLPSAPNDLNAVATNIEAIKTVNNNIDNIIEASNNSLNITTVADSIVKVGIVADNINNVIIVADDLTNINSVASNKTNIDIAASNITEIQNASANASVVTTKALEASNSATSAYNSSVSAGNSSTNASNSEIKANKWADNNYNVEVETGKYSAKHWATVSQNSIGVKVVENISSLKTFNINEANQIEVLGYYTKGDGGGGTFYWDNTSTETDNVGTIIQATGVATGRWKRVFSGAINVKWFGASPDKLDNKVYIEKAISYCHSIGGGTIYIPGGVYTIRGSLSRLTDGIRLKDGVNIIGDGNSSVIRLDSTCVIGFHCRTLTAITNIDNALNNVNISNIRIERPDSVWNNSYENTGLIELASANKVTIEKCSFVGWIGDAILVGINNDATLSFALDTKVANVLIRDNFFDGVTKDNRQAISFLDGYNVDIYKNYFTRTTRSSGYAMPGAIDFEPINVNATINNVNIYKNTFDDIGGAVGVITIALGTNLVSTAHNINIYKNIFKNITNTSDIFVNGKTSVSHTAVASKSPYNINVKNNIHTSTSANKKYIAGGVVDLFIEENIIEGGSKFGLFGYSGGVDIVPIDGLYIRRNKVKNLTFVGTPYEGIIYFVGGIIGGSIDKNVFKNCGNLATETLLPGFMTILQITGNGCSSNNFNISENEVINTSTFSVTSFPFYATTLTNPTTFSAKNNMFFGLSSSAYTRTESIYSQIPSDTYNGIVIGEDTATPSASGVKVIMLTSWATVTNFLYGKTGQIIIVTAAHTVTIQQGTSIKLAGAVNMSLNAASSLTLINRSGVWYEVSRSIN